MLKILARTARTTPTLPFHTLSSTNRFSFTIYSNQHQREKELVGEKTVRYDVNITEYDKAIKAFLGKRWTTKEELPPKIYIIDPIPEVKESLDQQKLVFMKKLYDQPRLEKMYEADEMNSQYLMSIALEEHFKPLCDEFLGKVLMNGQVVPMNRLQEQEDIVNKCRKIYMRFFYGDDLSELETDIETRYLINKQGKYMRYQATGKPIYRCVWTYTQQKRMELMKNYINRDLRYYDDFRPVYEPLNIESKLKNVYLTMDINKDPLKRRIIFYLFEKPYYERTRRRATFISQQLINRAMFYTTSLEFTRVMDIPPDFHIEHSLANLHVWLLLDRLRKIDSLESKFIAKQMEFEFKRVTLEKASQIHLKKKNDFINDVNHYMLNNRIAYDRHFNKNPKTSLRPYYKLDALVWSTVFFEKVPRYSNNVYMMSEYLIKHYEYLSGVSFEEMMASDVHWDVYRIPVNYRDVLEAVNVPLSEEELNSEINSDKKVKKHYYSYDDPEYELPINVEQNNIVKRRFENIHYKLFETVRKYNSLQSYDFYQEREDKEKQEEEQKKKYGIWGPANSFDRFTPTDEIKKKLHKKKSDSA